MHSGPQTTSTVYLSVCGQDIAVGRIQWDLECWERDFIEIYFISVLSGDHQYVSYGR